MKPGQVMAAVGIGYLLGRTKKMRLAMMIAAASAVSRLGDQPQQLLRRGVQGIVDLPEVGELTDSVRGGLAGAAKSAAVAMATNTVKSLNAKLAGGPGAGDKKRDDEPEDEEEPEDEPEPEDDADDREDIEDEQEDEEPRKPARRSSRSRAATQSRAPARPTRRAKR